jgi:hypothetical protein
LPETFGCNTPTMLGSAGTPQFMHVWIAFSLS